MAQSSILGADEAPRQPSGRDAHALGPSDNSDSGSDAVGSFEEYGDSDAAGTGERGSVDLRRARESADILPDRVVLQDGSGDDFSDADVDAEEFTDLDAEALGEQEDDDDSSR
jgi:hypothetical protein